MLNKNKYSDKYTQNIGTLNTGMIIEFAHLLQCKAFKSNHLENDIHSLWNCIFLVGLHWTKSCSALLFLNELLRTTSPWMEVVHSVPWGQQVTWGIIQSRGAVQMWLFCNFKFKVQFQTRFRVFVCFVKLIWRDERTEAHGLLSAEVPCAVAEGIFPKMALGTHLNPLLHIQKFTSWKELWILSNNAALTMQTTAKYEGIFMPEIFDGSMSGDFNSCLCNPWFVRMFL